MSIIQKIIKYFAIALAISIIVGIFTGIAFLGGLVVNKSSDGLDIDKFDDEQNILSISTGTCRVIIKEGEELKVETKNKYITSKQTDNKLAVTEKSHGLSKDSKEKVVVYIPEDMEFDKVYISNGAGEINIENLTCKDLEIDMGIGKIEIEKLTTSKNTNIDGGVGEFEIKNADIAYLDLDAGVGKVSITGSISGKSKIDAGVGELDITLLDNKENYNIHADKGLGAIKIDGKNINDETSYGKGKNKIEIDGGVGSINVKFDK